MPEGHDFRKIEGHVRKGQAVLLHSHVVHGSEPNRDPKRMRRNFLTSYLKEGAYFNPGNQMKREPIDIYEIRDKHWN
jgi:hypothetical protein